MSTYFQHVSNLAGILKVWQNAPRRLDVPGAYRKETERTMEKELYTQREAAKRLRIDPKTLRRLVREGRLPEVRLGPRLPRYRGQDLDALVVSA
jgi:excisionase family DNA binding protein